MQNMIRISKFFFLLPVLQCGVNTDKPVYPVFQFFPVGTPAIVDVKPVEIQLPAQTRIEFDIFYYVTNTEEDFIGYNLYISTATISPELLQIGIGGRPYLPEGYEPTFFHTREEASVESGNLKQRRIPNLKPAPSEIPFQLCERYYFRMTAVLRSGIQSLPSPEVSACAVTENFPCPQNTACHGN